MSEGRFPFPAKDEERIMRRRRRQALRRQTPVPAPESDSVSDGIESGESSDDESSSSGTSVQPQTQPPPPPSTSSIAPGPDTPTLTAVLPPAQATLLTSSSGRVIPTLTAILPPAQATLLTRASSSTSVTTSPQNADTSIQGNRNQPPPTSSSTRPATTSLPLSSISSSPILVPSSTSAAAVLPVGGITLTSMALTTATTFIPSSPSASATTKAPSPGNALGETTDSQVTGTERERGLSKGVETVIIVISVGAFLAVLVYVCLMFYRKLRQRKLEETTNYTNGTRSLWGGSDSRSSGAAPQMTAAPMPPSSGPLPTYVPPPARQQAPPPESNPFADPDPRRSALSNNAAERQERLGRVRADLLAPRELTGGLMRSATQRQGNLPVPNRGHIRSESGNNIGSNATASSGVFPTESADTAWPSGRVDASTMPPNQRLDIVAGGQWDDSVTVARYSTADTERSMPHWRTPSQWVTDQAKRTQGMSRLPG